jgi:hypothetical protein
MSGRRRLVAQLVIFVVFTCLGALEFVQATTLQKLSFDRLIEEADLIIKGRVEGTKDPAGFRSTLHDHDHYSFYREAI